MRLSTTFLLTLALVFASLAAKCPSNSDVKTAARVAAASAQAGIDEIDAQAASGELPADDAQFLFDVLREVRDASNKVAADSRDFSKLSPAERRSLVEDYIAYVNGRAEALERQGTLRIKKEKSRKKFEAATRDINRALEIARVFESALPPPSGPQATPPPSQ